MTAPQVVLVGVDGSETGRHALAWAVEEAVARRWGMLLVSAWSVPHIAGVDADLGQAVADEGSVRAAAEHVVRQAAAQVAAHPDAPPVSTRVEVGDAAGVLVAASRDAGLAVVGKRGRGGFAARLLGGVSIALPAHAACPTVVVPLPTRPPEPVPDVPPGAVVVGVDGSEASDHAAHVAAEQAGRWDAPLVLLCGIPVSAPVLAWMPVALDPGPMAEEARRSLAACATRIAGRHPGVDVRHLLVQESPARALTAVSAGARLVVVGARGHGGFAGMLLGSVSQATLAHARCPVLVVPRWCTDAASVPSADAG